MVATLIPMTDPHPLVAPRRTRSSVQSFCLNRPFGIEGIDNRANPVDESQSDQRVYVIVDLVTPGGTQYPLSFLKDGSRMNLLPSRAMDGLMIIGSEQMTVGHNSRGVGEIKTIGEWTWLTDYHAQHGSSQHLY